MNRLAKVFLFSVGILIVSGVILLCWSSIYYDRFDIYQLTVSSPKLEYTVGEIIELNYEIRSTNHAGIRVFKDRSKSLALFIRAAIGNKPDMEDSDFYSYQTSDINNNVIDAVRLSPEEPFRITVKGHIVENDKKDGIVFDFSEFGRFEKSRVGRFMIGGYWRPIRPHPADSLEDYTNKIFIEVRNRED